MVRSRTGEELRKKYEPFFAHYTGEEGMVKITKELRDRIVRQLELQDNPMNPDLDTLAIIEALLKEK
jgi:hypothetical protein